jgi:hypothetical protein
LNEEKLCQLLANQTRALQKRQPQAASHVHHLQIRPPQRQASLRVPETAAQVQTLSHVKMAEAVARNSALRQLMLHALHAQRAPSLKSVLQKLMAHAMRDQATLAMTAHRAKTARHTATATTLVVQSVQATATVTIELHAKIAVVTRVVQSAQHMETAMIVRLEVTVQHMATAITQVAQSVQTTVVVTGHLEATKVQVVQLKRLGVHAMIAMRARLTAIAMTALLVKTAALVTHVLHMEAVMQIARRALSAAARTVQHVQGLVVASATATVQSVLHTASQILHASKTALQSAVGQKIAGVTQVAIHLAKNATQTVQTVQHAMTHANHHSAVLATQTLTRRLSSKTRFLSV